MQNEQSQKRKRAGQTDHPVRTHGPVHQQINQSCASQQNGRAKHQDLAQEKLCHRDALELLALQIPHVENDREIEAHLADNAGTADQERNH
jgi:hypothetical protein